MKLTVDQYDTGTSADAMFQVRGDDCGMMASLVGCIDEMNCDITVSQEIATLVGAGFEGTGESYSTPRNDKYKNRLGIVTKVQNTP